MSSTFLFRLVNSSAADAAPTSSLVCFSTASYALDSASDTSQMKSWSSWDSGCPPASGNRVSTHITALNSPLDICTPHAW